MRRCFDLALKGQSNVAPNPLVGCVLVHDNTIIAEGFHEQYGMAHAEVNAIKSVKDRSLLANSTAYINLEPCSHYGKTPPCVDLILDSSIPEVVISNLDPNQLVGGKGVKKLLDNGVNVLTGILEQEGELLNRRFFTFHNLHRPYVTLKWAQSKDGFIGAFASEVKQQVKISCADSDILVHKWRSEEQSILVGPGTVATDNPLLTVRKWKGKHPLRIIIEDENKLLDNTVLKQYSDNSILISSNKNRTVNDFIHSITVPENSTSQILNTLYENDINSVLVEGGGKTLQSFIDSDLWDESRVITGDTVLGKGVPAPVLERSSYKEIQSGSDRINYYMNK